MHPYYSLQVPPGPQAQQVLLWPLVPGPQQEPEYHSASQAMPHCYRYFLW
jgi:hypothetical protein